MNPSTSAAATSAGDFATVPKKTRRSYAAASTVFGRHRPSRNSRYSSTTGIPSRTTGSPDGPGERITHGSERDSSTPPAGSRDVPWEGTTHGWERDIPTPPARPADRVERRIRTLVDGHPSRGRG